MGSWCRTPIILLRCELLGVYDTLQEKYASYVSPNKKNTNYLFPINKSDWYIAIFGWVQYIWRTSLQTSPIKRGEALKALVNFEFCILLKWNPLYSNFHLDAIQIQPHSRSLSLVRRWMPTAQSEVLLCIGLNWIPLYSHNKY